MKKKIFLLIVLFFAFFSFVNANEQISIFKKTFYKGNIQDKIKVVSDASLLDEDMTEIYKIAMDFVVNYANVLKDDAAMINLASLLIEQCYKVSEDIAVSFFKDVFVLYDSEIIKKDILSAIGKTKYTDSSLNSLLNDYGFSLLENSVKNDDLYLTMILAIKKIDNPVFFSLLFRYAASDLISENVRNAAENAVSSMKNDYKNNMMNIIEEGTLPEKRLALKIVKNDEKNSDFLRAEIAEKALQVSILYIGDTENKQDLIDFQLDAIRELRRVAWTRSADLIVKFFNFARSEYEAGFIQEDDYVEIIDCVSELASTKASSLLSDYLAFINSQTEQGISCSEPVVLAVITALGNLGNKIAFDNLLYVGYLSYSEEIIEASRIALAGLKF